MLVATGFDVVVSKHTSRALTNCSGRRALRISPTLDSRSNNAPAMLDSSSEGLTLEGEFGAIWIRSLISIGSGCKRSFQCDM